MISAKCPKQHLNRLQSRLPLVCFCTDNHRPAASHHCMSRLTHIYTTESSLSHAAQHTNTHMNMSRWTSESACKPWKRLRLFSVYRREIVCVCVCILTHPYSQQGFCCPALHTKSPGNNCWKLHETRHIAGDGRGPRGGGVRKMKSNNGTASGNTQTTQKCPLQLWPKNYTKHQKHQHREEGTKNNVSALTAPATPEDSLLSSHTPP